MDHIKEAPLGLHNIPYVDELLRNFSNIQDEDDPCYTERIKTFGQICTRQIFPLEEIKDLSTLCKILHEKLDPLHNPTLTRGIWELFTSVIESKTFHAKSKPRPHKSPSMAIHNSKRPQQHFINVALLINRLHKLCEMKDLTGLTLKEKSKLKSFLENRAGEDFIQKLQTKSQDPSSSFIKFNHWEMIKFVDRYIINHIPEYMGLLMNVSQVPEKISKIFHAYLCSSNLKEDDFERVEITSSVEDICVPPWNSYGSYVLKTLDSVFVFCLKHHDDYVINGISLREYKRPKKAGDNLMLVPSLTGRFFSHEDLKQKVFPCITYSIYNQGVVLPFDRKDLSLPMGCGLLLSFMPNRCVGELWTEMAQHEFTCPFAKRSLSLDHSTLIQRLSPGANIQEILMKSLFLQPISKMGENLFVYQKDRITHLSDKDEAEEYLQQVNRFVQYCKNLIDAGYSDTDLGVHKSIIHAYEEIKDEIYNLLEQGNIKLIKEKMEGLTKLYANPHYPPCLIKSSGYTWYIQNVFNYTIRNKAEIKITEVDNSEDEKRLFMSKGCSTGVHLLLMSALPYIGRLQEIFNGFSDRLESPIGSNDQISDFYIPLSVLQREFSRISDEIKQFFGRAKSWAPEQNEIWEEVEVFSEFSKNLYTLSNSLEIDSSISCAKRKRRGKKKAPSLLDKIESTSTETCTSFTEERPPSATTTESEGTKRPPSTETCTSITEERPPAALSISIDFEAIFSNLRGIRDIINHHCFRHLKIKYRMRRGDHLIFTYKERQSHSPPYPINEQDPRKQNMYLKQVFQWFVMIYFQELLQNQI